MKKILGLAVALAMVGAAWAGNGKVYNADVSVTATNTITQFTDNGSGGDGLVFAARFVLVRSLSSSANTCYFDLKDGTASTSDTALEPGGSIGWPFTATSAGGETGWSNMGSICSAGQTATFRVTAYR